MTNDLAWMETYCGGSASPCEYQDHVPEAHHHVMFTTKPPTVLAFACEGTRDCWEYGSGELYVSHAPAGFWDDCPDEWNRGEQ